MPHVFLNPDGTQEFGLFVIVEFTTGVTYSQQCAGLSNDLRTIEGFLIPIADQDSGRQVLDWFRTRFGSNSHPHGGEWPSELIVEIRTLVASIPCWFTSHDGNDQRLFLELDSDRIRECAEAWIPVITPYGRGILTFDNSD